LDFLPEFWVNWICYTKILKFTTVSNFTPQKKVRGGWWGDESKKMSELCRDCLRIGIGTCFHHRSAPLHPPAIFLYLGPAPPCHNKVLPILDLFAWLINFYAHPHIIHIVAKDQLQLAHAAQTSCLPDDTCYV
jgi:hypothetical protein